MWTCAIEGCGEAADGPEELLVHQASEHERHQCAVCGTVVPDGYFAIRHAFQEHTRAEYVRAYDADPNDVRHRESVMQAVEEAVDIEAVVSRIDGSPDESLV